MSAESCWLACSLHADEARQLNGMTAKRLGSFVESCQAVRAALMLSITASSKQCSRWLSPVVGQVIRGDPEYQSQALTSVWCTAILCHAERDCKAVLNSATYLGANT